MASKRLLAGLVSALLLGPLACSGDSGAPNGTPDAGLAAPQTPQEAREAWTQERGERSPGVSTTFQLRGALHLTGEGEARLETSATLLPGPSFPDDHPFLYLADAQVGEQTGLLVLEGERISLTASAPLVLPFRSAHTPASAADGGTAGEVELGLAREVRADRPEATFPEEWSAAQEALLFAEAVAVPLSEVSLSGFSRGVLLTAGGPVAVEDGVQVKAAARLFWEDTSRVAVERTHLELAHVALGGEVTEGTFTPSGLTDAQLPGAVVGHGARLVLGPGEVETEGAFQLTQAFVGEQLLLPAEVEVFVDAAPVKVAEGGRQLVEVAFREKTLQGDGLLSEVSVTGSGAEAVHVPLSDAPTLLTSLWQRVGEAGIGGPFLAVPLAVVSPFILVGEAILCLFGSCPDKYPVWMPAGEVSRFHVIVEGSLPPGSYEAQVTLTGRNYPAVTLPVHFTVEAK